jgi:hypothetical protein
MREPQTVLMDSSKRWIARFPIRLVVIVATVLSIAALGPSVLASTAGPSSTRSGQLHVTKECSEYTGAADSWCTITSSNLSAIAVGSRIVYLQSLLGDSATDSDLVVVVGPGNVALGHVHFPPSGPGIVTLSGGSGKFAHFHAHVKVTSNDPAGIVFHWDGPYWFSDDGD